MRNAIGIIGVSLGLALIVPGAWAQTANSAASTVTDATAHNYRLTYTLTEMDEGKRVDTHHFAIVLFSGQETELKEGSKVPISTGTYNAGMPTQSSQFQYLDVGLNIEATVQESADGIRLRTKLEQSGVAEEKSPMSAQDPIIRQTQLQGSALLTPGKPLMLGSMDIPGTTRRLDVEVMAELVR